MIRLQAVYSDFTDVCICDMGKGQQVYVPS